ncbi:MAG: DUF1553 domain-containing protein, partial [Bacteroidota bacterium]
LWRETITHAFFPEYKEDVDKGLYRRSLYTFWKRNAPAPAMLIFDASNRSECMVQRQRSNTPLQALVLMNSPQILEACRVLSEKALRQYPQDKIKALDHTVLAVLGRLPTNPEREILIRQFKEERSYFSKEPAEARKYLKIGHSVLPSDISFLDTAALARVANTVLNSTEAYYKN